MAPLVPPYLGSLAFNQVTLSLSGLLSLYATFASNSPLDFIKSTFGWRNPSLGTDRHLSSRKPQSLQIRLWPPPQVYFWLQNCNSLRSKSDVIVPARASFNSTQTSLQIRGYICER
ncbi:hypothetical protein B0H15DRAFT_825246 [Mycena belliarum]|uniref:Uncharacterized protein n=1 Tax=Mycena belliarum TaxID=1033014 RepID=A0AAD6XUT2_9AGAR|nr:hypothetical protein B0H15DRAFT_825246 [Mycena belliae]